MDAGEFFEVIVTLVVGGIVMIGILGGSVPNEAISFGENIIVVGFFAALAIAFGSQLLN